MFALSRWQYGREKKNYCFTDNLTTITIIGILFFFIVVCFQHFYSGACHRDLYLKKLVLVNYICFQIISNDLKYVWFWWLEMIIEFIFLTINYNLVKYNKTSKNLTNLNVYQILCYLLHGWYNILLFCLFICINANYIHYIIILWI